MDLKIKTAEEEFHGRTCGIIKQENSFLIMRVNETSYYHIPGGHIEIGEDSKQAIIREIKEEIGCDIKKRICLRYRKIFGQEIIKNVMELNFYYIIEPKENLEMKDYQKIEIDKGEEKLLDFKMGYFRTTKRYRFKT